MATRLLLVEDDHALAGGLVRGLKQHAFEVELVTSGTDAAAVALSGGFDLIILDLMLPGQSGYEVLAQLQHRSPPPVIVLTARTELEDRLRSFSLGAVDFLCKPFWIEELIARIRARLHISASVAKRVLRFGTLVIDLDARDVTVDEAEVKLTRAEYDILAYLAERPGRAIARAQLVTEVLPSLEGCNARTVDAHVTRIRKKLGPAESRIATVWGIGYRFLGEPPS